MKKLIFSILVILVVMPISAKEIPKKQWFEQMNANFADIFCEVVEINNCKTFTQHAVNMCLSQVWDRVPEKMQIPGDGKKYGALVGTCTEVLVRTVIKY